MEEAQAAAGRGRLAAVGLDRQSQAGFRGGRPTLQLLWARPARYTTRNATEPAHEGILLIDNHDPFNR